MREFRIERVAAKIRSLKVNHAGSALHLPSGLPLAACAGLSLFGPILALFSKLLFSKLPDLTGSFLKVTLVLADVLRLDRGELRP